MVRHLRRLVICLLHTALHGTTISGKFNELCEMLNKSHELLQTELDNLDSLLESFNLENHSMAILTILYVKLSSVRNIAQPITLFSQLTDFAINADANQIQNVPETCMHYSCYVFVINQVQSALIFRILLFFSRRSFPLVHQNHY